MHSIKQFLTCHMHDTAATPSLAQILEHQCTKLDSKHANLCAHISIKCSDALIRRFLIPFVLPKDEFSMTFA